MQQISHDKPGFRNRFQLGYDVSFAQPYSLFPNQDLPLIRFKPNCNSLDLVDNSDNPEYRAFG